MTGEYLLKIRQIRQYHYTADPKQFEEDHLVPITLGGCPRCPANLWPQPRNGEWNAQKKDHLENIGNRLVCDGQVPLDVMQKAIATDWIKAYKEYVK